MPAPNVYAREVHSLFGRYATWEPYRTIPVGAVGTLQDFIFVPSTDLSKRGISFGLVPDSGVAPSQKGMSSGTSEVDLSATVGGTGGPAAGGSAGLKITFSKQDSVYVSLANCTGQSIDDLETVGEEILKKVLEGQWKQNHVVVTRVVSAGSATILQAESNGASIELQGSVPGTPVTALMSAGGSVKVTSQKSVGIGIVAQGNLGPLLALAGVDYTFMDRMLGHAPSITYNPKPRRKAIAISVLRSSAESMSGVRVFPATTVKPDLRLCVRLARQGEFVDVGNLLDLTALVSVPRSSRSTGDSRPAPWAIHRSRRVPREHLLSVASQLPYAEVTTDESARDFLNLNINLHRSGQTVEIEPLFEVAMKSTKPVPHLSATAEISFHEIP